MADHLLQVYYGVGLDALNEILHRSFTVGKLAQVLHCTVKCQLLYCFLQERITDAIKKLEIAKFQTDIATTELKKQ